MTSNETTRGSGATPRTTAREGEDINAVGHGNSVAAWTAVGIILIGSLVASLAFPFAQPWLFWLGVVVIVAGAISGKVLTAMGFGEQHH